MLPNYLTRYCINDENPFISLNELEIERANKIKSDHCRKFNIGGFYKEKNYLYHRIEIEKWIYKNLIEKGGSPNCEVPIYMFLGESPKGDYDIRKDIQPKAKGYKLNINKLDIKTISFTYPDSMYEMIYDKNGIPSEGIRTNTPKVLIYDELNDYIIKNNILSNPKYSIEAQVWDKKRLIEIWEKKEYEIVN